MHNILISDFSLSTNQAWLGSKLELPLCRTVIQWILFPVVVNIFYAILNLEILNIANSFLLFKYASLELHSDTWCYGNAFAYFVVHSRYIMSKHANLAISIVPKPKHDGLTFCLEVQIHTSSKACVAAYPSCVQNGILWFWPNADNRYKDIFSKEKPPYIPEIDDPSFTSQMITRDIQYG